MTPLAAIPNTAAGQLVLAAVLAAAGFYLLLPRPRGRSCAGGTAALVAAVAVFGAWLHQTFGQPAPDLVGTVLFYLHAAGALIFGTVLVVQRNPARGAIAFAFVVLSTCGLFLLLGAPFLAAATIIVYAGAIVVTFLFVLMLSHAAGPSDENDRSREPLFGSLAGFAFATLILFALLHTHTAPADQTTLPAPVLTPEERTTLNDVAKRLGDLATRLEDGPQPSNTDLTRELTETEEGLARTIGTKPVQWIASPDPPVSELPAEEGSAATRLYVRAKNDSQAAHVFARFTEVSESSVQTFRDLENRPPLSSDTNRAHAVVALRKLRDEVRLLAGTGELPARNVGTIGLTLYSDHLFAVELAGTLLLIATIGAIAIAHRKGAAA